MDKTVFKRKIYDEILEWKEKRSLILHIQVKQL